MSAIRASEVAVKSMLGMCLDPRVLIGVGAAALGIWLFAPQYIAAALPLLIVLACPLSMVAMALLMRGSMGGGSKGSAKERLADLESKQSSLAQQVASTRAELEAPGQPTARSAR